MFITFISITIDSTSERFPCTQRSAQKNFHTPMKSYVTRNERRI